MNNPVYFSQKKIPRDEGGKPSFRTLEEIAEVFSESEIVELVNRQIKYTDSQRSVHAKYYKRQTQSLAPLKKKARELFSSDWDILTDEERGVCIAELKKEASASSANSTIQPMSASKVLRPPLRRVE